MRVLFALCIFGLTPPCLAATLLDEVSSQAFEAAQIPPRRIPSLTAPRIAAAQEYPRASLHSMEISEFIAEYGIPSKLVKPKSGKGYSYLVYELSGGYKILVYVPYLDGTRFVAAQLFRSNGQPEGPLLK